MSAKKVGKLIKEARTNAGLTQEKLASKVAGLSASELGKAERGEKELTTDQLKAIAKATGVTQKSLLEAAGSSTAKSTSKTTTKTTKTTSSQTSIKVSATEKRLVELYREADTDTKKTVMSILRGESLTTGNILGDFLEDAIGTLLKK